MKPLNIIAVVAIAAIFIGAGCDFPETPKADHSEPTSVGHWGRFVEMEHKGHTYLLFDFSGPEAGGAICHSESCRCKTR